MGPSKKQMQQRIDKLEAENADFRERLKVCIERYYQETAELAEIIEIQRALLRQDNIEIYEECDDPDCTQHNNPPED